MIINSRDLYWGLPILIVRDLVQLYTFNRLCTVEGGK